MTVFLALIHNNEESRLAKIRPALGALVGRLDAHGGATLREFSYQPGRTPLSKALACRRELAAERLAFDWARYREKPQGSWRHAKRQAKTALRCLAPADRVLERLRRAGPVDLSVTDKHIRAWDAFLDSGAEHFIAFEDDAVFADDSIDRLIAEAGPVLTPEAGQTPRYWDLAGGFLPDDLGIEKLETGRDGAAVLFRKPVTNTTCSYLASRALIEVFRFELLRNPHFRLFSADWMLNRLFLMLDQRAQPTECRHFRPTILSHGSFTGDHAAWER